MLRTGQIATPPIEAADGAWFESRTVTKPVGPKTPTHRPPWNANGLPAGATQKVTPADKRKTQGY